jgi:hypothetical protein
MNAEVFTANMFGDGPENGSLVFFVPVEAKSSQEITLEKEVGKGIKMANSFEVCARKGHAGPGIIQVVIATKEDAEKVKEDLSKEVKGGVEVIVREHIAPTILTYGEWKAQQQANQVKQNALASVLEKIKAAGLSLDDVKAKIEEDASEIEEVA